MGLHVPLLVQLQLQAQFLPKRPLGQTVHKEIVNYFIA